MHACRSTLEDPTARITPAGLALLAAVDPRIDQVAAAYTSHLSETEWRQLGRACQRMLA